jgi:predicted transcriptional regulator
MPTVSETLRRSLDKCGMTPAEVSRTSGVAESVLSRFAAGAQLRSDNLDALCNVLGLELVEKRKNPKRKGR